MIERYIIYLIISGIILFILWLHIDVNKPCVIVEFASEDIQAAVMKMGPGYRYLYDDGKLYVDKGDGKWLKLKY